MIVVPFYIFINLEIDFYYTCIFCCLSMNSSCFIFLNSILIVIKHVIAAIKSATGPANIIPSIPKNRGSIIIIGSRYIICLVKDKNIPFIGFPIDVKNVDDSGCTLFINVKKRYM